MHQHDQMYSHEYEEDDNYEWDSQLDDEYFGSYLIQASDRTSRRFRPSLPRTVWESLSKSDQLAWDQISIKGKWDVIKGLRKTANPSTQNMDNSTVPTLPSTTVTSENKGNSIKFQTRVNESSINSNDSLKNESSSVSSITEPTHPSKTGSMLINAVKSTTNVANEDDLHPADLRKFLSEDHIKRSKPTVSQSSPSKFKVNQHTYRILSFVHSSKRGALVDRGANGSMAGADM